MSLNTEKINSPLVSIVVPCYNVEHYITKGLESVFKQTYSNWECIVINDGSTDNTENEIKKWTKLDQRFKLITQQNKGLSGARNAGLKHINGECIYFFDPDDLLDKNCLTELTNLYQNDIDIVIGKIGQVYNQTTTVIGTSEHASITNTRLENINFIEFALKDPFSVVAWNKLYKTDFIVSNGLTFKDGIVHEDELWFFKIMYNAKKIIFNSEVTYYYNIGNQSSITKNYSLYNLKSYLTVIEAIYTEYYATETNEKKKLIIGTYILNLQIPVVSAFFRFTRKHKNASFKDEGITLIKKHLKAFSIKDYFHYDNIKSKQFELFIHYAESHPETAFKLVRNTYRKSIIKGLENVYLKYKFKPKS